MQFGLWSNGSQALLICNAVTAILNSQGRRYKLPLPGWLIKAIWSDSPYICRWSLELLVLRHLIRGVQRAPEDSEGISTVANKKGRGKWWFFPILHYISPSISQYWLPKYQTRHSLLLFSFKRVIFRTDELSRCCNYTKVPSSRGQAGCCLPSWALNSVHLSIVLI